MIPHSASTSVGRVGKPPTLPPTELITARLPPLKSWIWSRSELSEAEMKRSQISVFVQQRHLVRVGIQVGSRKAGNLHTPIKISDIRIQTFKDLMVFYV